MSRTAFWATLAVAVLTSWVSLADEPPAPPPTASTAPTEAPPRLRVGFAGSEPFVLDGGKDGLSVAVWREVAEKAGFEFEVVGDKRPVKEALGEVADGHLDVAVGPISITAERAKLVRFTQPYFQSRLAIMGPVEGRSSWDKISPYISATVLTVFGVLLVVLFSVGTLLWLTERKVNPDHFPPQPLRGIGNGVWCAIVTATSVGYGDRVPTTVPGRVVASIWMVLAIFGASSLTAAIASALTVLQLESAGLSSPEQLSGRPVAAVHGTTGADFARRHGARMIEHATLPEAIAAVERGDAEAIVHDRPILVYHLQQHPSSPLAVSLGGYEPQGYGFAVRDPQLEKKLNVALLELAEDHAIDNIRARWLGSVADE